MINKYEQIPVTTSSHPLTAAAGKCGFEENGYIEEELFFHGTANVNSKERG